MIDEKLNDQIHETVTRYHDEHAGLRWMRVGAIRHALATRYNRTVTWAEVQLACDELVEQDRLLFLMDSGRGGRRYCSPAADETLVQFRTESL